jgi:hypothetical protein
MVQIATDKLWTDVRRFGTATVQLALLLVVLRQFQIESNAFMRIAVLAFGGFVVHYFLPHRFKLPFFGLLSFVGILVVMGPASTAWIALIGGILIGICHLPVSFRLRTVLLLSVGSLLAFSRAGQVWFPWSEAIWPVLASMFMFRLIIYLYDLKHDKAPFSWTTVSYFFMLPNVCFPMFPLVDYKTFRRNYYDTDAYKIYQVGIEWMTRGVTHLILYRFVYYYLTLSPAEVTRPRDFLQLAVTTFLLYLRISGQFHLIVGMLHLFGFHLPETHHRYLLASSFTDHWRRINIYWKDFMMKIFYYPMYFRLRSHGTTAALVVSTLFVFVATWFLHLYQWFWLRGSVLISGPDITFWSVLAVLVLITVLYESRYGGRKKLNSSALNLKTFATTAVCTVGTFLSICLLWSLWTSESLTEWFALWQSFGNIKLSDLGKLSVFMIGAAVAGGVLTSTANIRAAKRPIAGSLRQGPLPNLLVLTLLAAIGIQGIYSQFGSSTATLINSLRSGRLSRLDSAAMQKGYYEDLNRVERFNSQLWELYMKRPSSMLDVVGTGLERFTGDFLQKELVPSFQSRTNYGTLRTNRWGMRDKDYEKAPPPGTYRIALMGASSVMGWGVGDDETFESVVEHRLNAEHPADYRNFEILNFALPGYTALHQVVLLDKAFSFHPNALFYVATGREGSIAANYLAEASSHGIPLPDDYLKNLVMRAGVPAKTSQTVAAQRLIPYRTELLSWTYRTIVRRSHELGILPVLIFLPQLERGTWEGETPEILVSAREAGFMVWDLTDVFNGNDIESIRLAEWDFHPNARGHALIASRLYALLNQNAHQVFAFDPDR